MDTNVQEFYRIFTHLTVPAIAGIFVGIAICSSVEKAVMFLKKGRK